MAKNKEEKKSFQDLAADLNKKYSGNTNIEYFDLSTGSIALDKALGGGIRSGRITELIAWEGSGKAQPLSSKILTPLGWIKMHEAEIGTIISTPDGKDSTIIGVFPQGIQDVYKITFDDKSSTFCTLDHLWQINSRGTELGEVLTTKELLKKGLKDRTGKRKYKIPTTSPVQFEKQNITINPYLLGLLLGDGGLTSGGVKISNVDEEILNSIKRILDSEYENMCLSTKQGLCTYTLKMKKRHTGKNEIYKELENMGLIGKYSYDKSIPDNYIYNTVETRIALLQGLMDTDGSADGNSMSFSTTSEILSNQFVELCRSLGMRCTTSSRITKYTSSTGNKIDGRRSYRSNILMNTLVFKPFRLTKHLNKYNVTKGLFSEKFIENIEFSHKEECQCIAIGHPDKLYITDDYIVTHNTTLCLHVIAEAQKKGMNVAYVDAEHALDEKYARAIGVDWDKLKPTLFQPMNGEDAFQYGQELLKSGELQVLVFDSTSGMLPKSQMEAEPGGSNMGKHALLFSKEVPKINIFAADNNAIVIFVSQVREKIGVMFGSPEVTQAGNTLKFFASNRIDLRKSLEKDGDEVIGINTKFKVLKCKTSSPYKTGVIPITFGVGIDKILEITDLATDLGLIKKWGKSIFILDGSDVKYDLEEFQTLLKDNEEFYQDLRQKVMDKLN